MKKDDKPFKQAVSDWLEEVPLDFPPEISLYTDKKLEMPLFLHERQRIGTTLFEG